MPGNRRSYEKTRHIALSGLLFALPALSGDSVIKVLPPVESRAYIDITLGVLRSFGIEISEPEPNIFTVRGGQRYEAGEKTVEGDWSNAAFWLCAGAIGCDPITVEGVSLSSAQGDRNVLAALSRFGARIVRSTNAATVQSDLSLIHI